MRIVFMDKDKGLCCGVEKLFKRYYNYFDNIELEVDYGDIAEKNEGVFVTASNPNFNPAGGLDKLLHDKFPKEWKNLEEGVRTEHLFPVVSVDESLKSDTTIIQRALALVLAQPDADKDFYSPDADKDFYLTGIGTGIGGFPKDEFVRIFERLLRRDWSYTDFKGVYLKGALLKSLNLQNCQFEQAQLERAVLVDSTLCYSDFSEANLKGAYLVYANFFACGMERATLNDSYLRAANLSSVDLSRSDLKGAYLEDALLEDTNLYKAKISGTTNLANTCFDAMTVGEFLEKYGIKRKGDKIVLYKGVTRSLFSPMLGNKKYLAGKVVTEKYCNFNAGEVCANGLHVCPTPKDAFTFGVKILEVEVDIKDIVAIPKDGSKIRVKRLKVLGEVKCHRKGCLDAMNKDKLSEEEA